MLSERGIEELSAMNYIVKNNPKRFVAETEHGYRDHFMDAHYIWLYVGDKITGELYSMQFSLSHYKELYVDFCEELKDLLRISLKLKQQIQDDKG